MSAAGGGLWGREIMGSNKEVAEEALSFSRDLSVDSYPNAFFLRSFGRFYSTQPIADSEVRHSNTHIRIPRRLESTGRPRKHFL